MDAKEAEEIAYKRLSQSDRIEIERIEEEIPRLARHGLLNTCTEYAVGRGVLEYFEAKGFKVRYFLGSNGFLRTAISWTDFEIIKTEK